MTRENNKAPVSVIIPCYCCDDTIERAVLSVADQVKKPSEIILIDDASPDHGKTLAKLHEIKKKYSDSIQIHITALPSNDGPATARNAAWNLASQPYIAFLDADDAWHPQKIELQYGWMKAHPEVDMTGHGTAQAQGESPPSIAGVMGASPVRGRQLLLSNRFPTRSVMIRRDVPFRFCSGKRYAEDFLLWLRLVLTGHSAWKLDRTLAFTYKPDFGAGGLSADMWRHEKGELDTYARLHEEQLITLTAYRALIIFSLIKYVRRLLIHALRNITT